MAFGIASTNLVIELGIILALLMGHLTLAEFIGGPIMIVAVALGFRPWIRGRIVDAARKQADLRIAGSMEGHAAMDVSVQLSGTVWRRLFSRYGFTAVANFYVMDWASVARDIVIGLLIAGAFAAWVPTRWLQSFFITSDPTAAKIWGPVIGPLVAVLSFGCSIGNVPLAAVLWNGGIFGGVVSFIFADLIIVPIILIYRKYYGTGAALRITGIFYLAMVAAGYIVEVLFGLLGLVPTTRSATVIEAGTGHGEHQH